jgi:hypothetical protein
MAKRYTKHIPLDLLLLPMVFIMFVVVTAICKSVRRLLASQERCYT